MTVELSNNQRLRNISVKVTSAENHITAALLDLAEGDALSTEEYETHFDKNLVHDANQKLRHVQATLAKAIDRARVLHEALLAASNTADFPRDRTGK